MSAVPVHEQQLTPNPNYGSWRGLGDGRFGAAILPRMANGGVALRPQRTAVTGHISTVIGTIICDSTMQSTPNGYEGIGLHVRVLRRDGNNLVETWSNTILTAGKLEYWINDAGGYRPAHIIVQIPEDKTGDFIETAWVFRGTGGEVLVDSVSIRHHHERRFLTTIGEAVYSDFNYEQINSEFGWARRSLTDIRRLYLDTYFVNIAKNQKVEMTLNTALENIRVIGGSRNTSSNPGVGPQLFGIALKLTLKNNSVEWYVFMRNLYAMQDEASGTSVSTPIQATYQFTAKSSYKLIEPILFFAQSTADQQYNLSAQLKGGEIIVTAQGQAATGAA